VLDSDARSANAQTIVVSTAEDRITILEAQLEEARDEANLNLLIQQQVQEELKHYFLKCQELTAAALALQDEAPAAASAPDAAQHLSVGDLRIALPLLLAHLGASELFQLGLSCYSRGHHKMALVLLDAAVSSASSADPALAAHAQLQAVRARLALGRMQGAERILTAMAEQELADPAVRHQVLQQLARLALGRADTAAARQHLTALAELPPHEGSAAATSELHALLEADAAQPDPSGAATLLPSAEAPGLSLDVCSLSPCGRFLHLEGWLIDPTGQLGGLALRRAGQLLPLAPEQFSRRVRSDLSHLLAEHGLPADHPAGFSLSLALAEEQAVAPASGDLATIFLLRPEGPALTVSTAIAIAPPTADRLIPLLGPWLNPAHTLPADGQHHHPQV
jgi:hypothetical protein